MIWRESGRMERLSHQKIFNSFCGLKIYYLILIREHQQFVSVANNRSLRKIAGVLNLHCDICKFLRHTALRDITHIYRYNKKQPYVIYVDLYCNVNLWLAKRIWRQAGNLSSASDC